MRRWNDGIIGLLDILPGNPADAHDRMYPEGNVQLIKIRDNKQILRMLLALMSHQVFGILAEDSVLLASMICESLKKAGFSNVKRFNNGKEAWEFLHASLYIFNGFSNHTLIHVPASFPVICQSLPPDA